MKTKHAMSPKSPKAEKPSSEKPSSVKPTAAEDALQHPAATKEVKAIQDQIKVLHQQIRDIQKKNGCVPAPMEEPMIHYYM